jgi:hypothetical protein
MPVNTPWETVYTGTDGGGSVMRLRVPGGYLYQVRDVVGRFGDQELIALSFVPLPAKGRE